MPHLKKSWFKDFKVLIVFGLILLAFSVLGGIVMNFYRLSEHVLFIYAKSDSAKQPQTNTLMDNFTKAVKHIVQVPKDA